MTKVGFIGLGHMGHGMAGRYLDAGFTVAVWNRSKAKAEDLIARGARWASSPADAADLDSAKPFLAPIGDVVRHFGAVGTGTVFKLINNLIGAVQIASLAEGVAMAEQAGLDMKLVAEALATGAVASPQVIRHSKRMVARDFSGASFTAALRHKDAAYAVALAEALLPAVPVSRAALAADDKAEGSAPDD